MKEVKETREAKQEECKVCEDDDASELYKVIFKNKVLKLSSPPEPIKTYCIKVIALSALKKFAADTICNSFSYPCLIDIFGNIPRYIAFHSLIFYEV
ncbi:MAG: hypothetical protein NZM38_00360 [Cytophagales bacterium]|nr:hypothetical protein [Cytophagales bacterium]MDW8383200.1 hypothetical protein [Flammeovirgaceae bacterium]